MVTGKFSLLQFGHTESPAPALNEVRWVKMVHTDDTILKY